MVKKRVLEYLENNKGNLVSGGELSKKLNVSRTAIWKSINSLKEEGYNIEAVSNQGYKLNTEYNILSENIIRSNLNTKILGSEIQILKTVNSTNIYLKSKATSNKNETEGLVVIANEQTSGKGRMSKKFFAPPSSGIYMSFLLYPNMKISQINILTIVASIAVLKAIEIKTGVKTNIKWVNDILYSKKKLCGILTEASVESESGFVEFVVVGIGINVGKMDLPENIKDVAISIENITNRFCDRNELIAEVLNQFELLYFDLIKDNNKQKIINIYRQNLAMVGEVVQIIQGNKNYYSKICGVDDEGRLIIEDDKKQISTINCGEISIKTI